jgi:Mrp family chromosome partitioning ATPase
MDFIQRAIDKAREQRERSLSNETASRPARTVAPTNTEQIEYTQTRTMKPNPKHLLDQLVIAGFDNEPRAEVYRQLRTQVLQKMREKRWRTLAVTSPNSHAGKSLTALNLAISMSKEVNQTVLLVDLDLRNPTIADKLGIDVTSDLVDCLEGRAILKDALVNPGFERLVVLPNARRSCHRSEMLSSPSMNALVRDIVSRYESRIIIFDLPAVLDDDDAMTFAPFADALLMIVEDGVTRRADVERSLKLMQGIPLLGTVLNKAR